MPESTTTTKRTGSTTTFTADERAAMRERATELSPEAERTIVALVRKAVR